MSNGIATAIPFFRKRSKASPVAGIATGWDESNRESQGCIYYLISQPIDNDFKNFLINNLLIHI
jgi:hypothetical protein